MASESVPCTTDEVDGDSTRNQHRSTESVPCITDEVDGDSTRHQHESTKTVPCTTDEVDGDSTRHQHESTESVACTKDEIDGIAGRHQHGSTLSQNMDEEHKRILKAVIDLKNVLPVIRREDDFKEEFEKRFPDFENDIAVHTSRLEERRPIVFVGETSSGKSSFINAMLQASILPVDTLHCTAGIIKIMRAQDLRIIPKGRKAIVPDTILKKKQAIKFVRDRLKTLVTPATELSKDEENPPCMEIEVHWPFESTLLKDGISLVDMPGISDSKDMKKMAMEYMKKAVGFIYVVNSANAGGIQEAVLLQFLRDQYEYSVHHGLESIAINEAVFIFNKWDTISTHTEYDGYSDDDDDDDATEEPANLENEKRLWEMNINKLKKFWDGFQYDKAMRFSALQARGKINCPWVEKDQVKIAKKKIQEVVEVCMKYGVDPDRNWLNGVNGFMERTIASHLDTAYAIKKQKEAMLRKFEKKKKELEDRTDKIKREITKEIKSKSKEFAQKFETLIRSENVKAAMSRWHRHEFPCSFEESPEVIKEQVLLTVSAKLHDIINQEMKNEWSIFNDDLKKYVSDEMEDILQLLNDLDIFTTIEFKSWSAQLPSMYAMKCLASDLFLMFGVYGYFHTLAGGFISFIRMSSTQSFGNGRFILLIMASLGMIKGGDSCDQRVTILKETSKKALESITFNTISTAMVNNFEHLNKRLNTLFDSYIPQTIESLKQRYFNIYNSTEDPEHIIERYTRLRRDLQHVLEKI